jgi:hypothetical protein
MRSRSIVAALFVFLCTAGSASSQVLSLEFQDGRVKLTAENVPVGRILAEWARLGGTQIVNGDRIPGAPVTLTLDTPERQALDTILRGAAGYMALARDGASTGASSLAKILILPTTTRAPAAAALPQPVPQPVQFPRPEPDAFELEEPDDPPQPPTPPPGFPRGRIPNLNRPIGVPPQEAEDDDRNNDDPNPNEAPAPAPGNPFGVVPGGARPGTVNPAPRDPNVDPSR